ncbi:NAD(P)/FAD-dependent oxidoreductase [Zooshikella ganghwensis]|uniref:NAD(P)/FAD-dependent oxidoreductase n=1 Tax=Zooshikella ganghwensis TaxID=202772 RepID=UPI001E656D57|nr:FAD-binding oxidoreductase [Zooshikella ganghwensis]
MIQHAIDIPLKRSLETVPPNYGGTDNKDNPPMLDGFNYDSLIHTKTHPLSYYAATRKPWTWPQLQGEQRVDVCIIGAGFTGLSTALSLAEQGYHVAVLEAHQVGWGASGRNGGQVLTGIGHGLDPFRKTLGETGIQLLWDMGHEAVKCVSDLIHKYQIDCDLTWGFLETALKPSHMKAIAEHIEACEHYHYPHRLQQVNQENIQQYINSSRYIGGLIDMGGAHLHPLNLCLGEAQAATKLGVQVYENSPVHSISRGKKVIIQTPHGTIKANYLVAAGNAYLGHLIPEISGKILPAGSYMIATEPLGELRAKQLLPYNMAVCDLRTVLDYFRLSADHRLLFGGLCTYTGKHPKNIQQSLYPAMLKVFPQLSDIKIDYAWGGYLGIGMNRMPQLGIIDNNIIYAQAYAGHGVSASHLLGQLIAEAINGDHTRFAVLEKIKHHNFPGGRRFRSPLLALGMLYYQLRDWLH